MSARRSPPAAGPLPGRRILITGLGSYWGGRIARALEADPGVEAVVGLDTVEPSIQLERTEFVRADDAYTILARLVRATQVDTIVHASLIVDSTTSGSRRIHDNNVIGTLNLLAAAGAADSAVTQVVVKSSALVYGASATDPTWFAEDSRRRRPGRTSIERGLLEVEAAVRDFELDHPGVDVAVLRFANVLGSGIDTPISRALCLPAVPTIAGFDPQLQLVEAHDVVSAMEFAVRRRLAGIYNVAGDGRLPWSELRRIMGRPPLLLPPLLTAAAAEPLARLHLVHLPAELLDLLRYGRGLDNSKLIRAGFVYDFDTAGAVERLAARHRLRRAVGSKPVYRYQGDVEAFFRHSPAVVRPG